MSWIIKAEEAPTQEWFDNLVRTVEAERGNVVTNLSSMMSDISEQAAEFIKSVEKDKRENAMNYVVTNIKGILNRAFSGSAFSDELERVLVVEDIEAHLKSEVDYLNQGEESKEGEKE